MLKLLPIFLIGRSEVSTFSFYNLCPIDPFVQNCNGIKSKNIWVNLIIFAPLVNKYVSYLWDWLKFWFGVSGLSLDWKFTLKPSLQSNNSLTLTSLYSTNCLRTSRLSPDKNLWNSFSEQWPLMMGNVSMSDANHCFSYKI